MNQPMRPPVEVDVAIVGGGGAGLSLLLAIERAIERASEGANGRTAEGATERASEGANARKAPSIVVIDPVRRARADRTWCWWTDRTKQWFDPLLSGEWSSLTVIGRQERQLDLGRFRYVMLRSDDFYAEAEKATARRLDASAEQIVDGAEWATIHLDDGSDVRARWVFDSRPAPPRRPGSVLLLQHFRGWKVRFDEPVLDPRAATLMDFRVPQPGRGVAFAYCLPTDDRRALVEYTEFSRERRPPAAYDLALRAYLRDRWNGVGYEVEAVEDGVIPMTDAPFTSRAGRRIFRLGTAGGATRPSTGYTFAAMQRQADSVAEALVQGRSPVPSKPYPGRHLWLDAVMLRALDRGYVNGADLFENLFAGNPPERLVRFLDGSSSPGEDLSLMHSTPIGPMMRASVADVAARAARAARASRRLTPWSRSVAPRHTT